MAFEALQEKFSRIVKTIKGESKLTEKNMEAMLKEVRIALLEADVNYKVVKVFVSNVKEKALGQQVYTKLNPSEMVIKIVKDELVELLGSDRSELAYNKNKPTIIMLVGLQGSGKTTTAAKLANLMKNKLKKLWKRTKKRRFFWLLVMFTVLLLLINLLNLLVNLKLI